MISRGMFLLLLGACLLAWISVMGGVLAWAPSIESKWFPPIVDFHHMRIERHGRAICWYNMFRKVRNAVLVQNVHWLDYSDQDGAARDQILVTLDGIPVPTGAVVETGPMVQLGPYCADLPVENGHVLVDINPRPSHIHNIRVYRTNIFWDTIMVAPLIMVPKEPVIQYGESRDIKKFPCAQCHK